MEQAYLNKSIVILGAFKPANFDKLFLVKSGLIEEGDFDEDSIFLPEYAQISTPQLYIQVHPNRVNINLKNFDFVLSGDKIQKLFVDSSISAVGINFKKGLLLDSRSRYKDFFYFENNILNKHFKGKDNVYGYFVSEEFDNYRLTLNIKPVRLQRVEDTVIHDSLEFSFNFNFRSHGIEILDCIDRIDELEMVVNNIISDYELIG